MSNDVIYFKNDIYKHKHTQTHNTISLGKIELFSMYIYINICKHTFPPKSYRFLQTINFYLFDKIEKKHMIEKNKT